jgi:eukaryotic-like serine/threonine-protein kinase
VAVLVAAGVAAAVVLTRGGGGSGGAGGRTAAATTTAGPGAQISSAVQRATENTAVVPSVVGLGETEASARITSVGLQALGRTQTSPRRRGVVIAQNPAAGKRLAHGALVGLVVSAGPRSGTVPAVVGLPVARAIAVLRATGLGVRARHVPSQRRAGLVDAQSPAAGTRLRHGVVRLAVSEGPPPVTVPVVVGSTRARALRALHAAGLVASVQRLASQRPAGTVIAQSPPGGTRRLRGSAVRIRVSSGP